jgi:hypothetical protein
MRSFSTITLLAFGFIACRRAQPSPPSPDSTSHVRPVHSGLECALWSGMQAEERRLAALGAIESALHDVKGPLSPEVAWCQIGQLETFVAAYVKTCAQTPPPSSPSRSVFEGVLADCVRPRRDPELQRHAPLHRDSAPALTCPAGAALAALDGRGAEFCSRPGELLDGPAREWFANGSQRSADSWASGKKVGTWFSWSEDGTSVSARSYRDGKLDGPEVFWFPNGQRRTLTYYRGDKKNGVVAEWSEAGQQIVLGGFENDQKNGLWYFRKPGTDDAIRVAFEHGHEKAGEAAIFPCR